MSRRDLATLSLSGSVELSNTIQYNNTIIFILCPEKFTIDKYMQREKVTIKNEHSHLEIAKTNRAKWLGQAEKNIAIKLQSIKKNGTRFPFTHTHTENKKKEK